MNKIKIAIDASRNRSGGAKIHLIGILNEFNINNYNIKEIHLWSYPDLLKQIPDYPWLIKHCPSKSPQSIFKELYWQNKKLPILLKQNSIDVLLNTDAGSICYFKPSITMSRDMLSYEKGEMKRFGISIARLRLILLKYVQKKSLLNSNGAIFLTKYASEIIQKFNGKIKNYKIINHGIGENFRIDKEFADCENKRKFKCLYISNVSFYKHQWNVVRAFKKIKDENDNIELVLAGGLGSGKPRKLLENAINEVDPDRKFILTLGQIPHEKIPDIINEADLFIFASSCENMPNTLVEAMASGIPIACSNRGPMPEILGDSGLYFNPEDIDSIYQAVIKLIYDKNLRSLLSNKTKEISNKFSWKKCSEKTFDYLVEIHSNFNNKIKDY